MTIATRIVEGQDYMTALDVCSCLGIGRTTLYRLMRDEGFPSFKVRRGKASSRRFRRASVERWVAAREAEGAEPWRNNSTPASSGETVTRGGRHVRR